MMIGIYKIENLVNHKIYIGQSINIERRWKQEKQRAFQESAHEYNYPISKALRKYGIDNFSFSVIEECSVDKLNEREKFWIAYYNSFFSGYNQTFGGDSTIMQPKEKILGIFYDLENSQMTHRMIAQKWNISMEMVQGINTGRYWKTENKNYPLQKTAKKHNHIQKTCKQCGVTISSTATLCKECACKASRIVERPDRESLKTLIRSTPFTKIATMYGVSDTAIRKWCDTYNLPRQKYEIKNYSDEEWNLI